LKASRQDRPEARAVRQRCNNPLPLPIQRRAHTNSVAKIANPAGITTTAGPGRMIIATPISTTVPPMMAMKNFFMAMIPDWIH